MATKKAKLRYVLNIGYYFNLSVFFDSFHSITSSIASCYIERLFY